METSLVGIEGQDVSGLPQLTKLSSLPSTLILRSFGIVLKTPIPEDDAVMCEILSDPVTMKHLTFLSPSGGWTIDSIAARRETQASDQLQGKCLTVNIHLPAKKDSCAMEEGKEHMVLAGTTGLFRIDLENGTCEAGIILHHPYWKQGVATVAMYLCLRYGFETIGLNRIDWITGVENDQMRGWCESILHLKPFEPEMENVYGYGMVGYSLHRSEWHSRVCHILEQRVSSRK